MNYKPPNNACSGRSFLRVLVANIIRATLTTTGIIAQRQSAANANRWVAEMDVPYKLYKGNCLEIMPTLEAGSVDAIITDLPYGTTACAWDVVIPLDEMWKQVKRILKPSGAFITTASQPFASVLINSNLTWFRNEIIWEKERPTNPLLCNKQVLKYHENILLFSKSQVTYNPQMTKKQAINKRRNKPREYNTETIGSKPSFSDMCLAGENEFIYPASIQYFTMDRGEHPTQKPVALYNFLIRTYTNQSELVLDITMGSGTTGVSSMQTGRRFIGIEKEQAYFSIAEKRISQAAQQPALFYATQQSVQRTGGESGQQSLFSADEVLPAKVTRQTTRR